MSGYVLDIRGPGEVFRAEIPYAGPERKAVADWLRFHDIDPNFVPWESTIRRDAPNRCIRYERIETHDGLVVWSGDRPVIVAAIEQGEAPPLPFPQVVLDRMVDL